MKAMIVKVLLQKVEATNAKLIVEALEASERKKQI